MKPKNPNTFTVAACWHYPSSNIRLLHTPTTRNNSCYSARRWQLLQWHQTLLFLRAKGTLHQNFFTLAHVLMLENLSQGSHTGERLPKVASVRVLSELAALHEEKHELQGIHTGLWQCRVLTSYSLPYHLSPICQEAEQTWGVLTGSP